MFRLKCHGMQIKRTEVIQMFQIGYFSAIMLAIAGSVMALGLGIVDMIYQIFQHF